MSRFSTFLELVQMLVDFDSLFLFDDYERFCN